MAALEFLTEAPESGRVIAFPSKAFTIGSDETCAVRLSSELVAARHAEIVMDDRGQWWVRDLAGAGRVAVNNTPILDERLSPGDRLRVGDVVLLVQDSGVNVHARTRSGDSVPVAPIPLGEPLGEPTRELRVDTVIDNRYRVISKLAEGGMGEVYRAVHVELGKPLALKVMLPELSSDPDFVARFKREAIASSRIGHPNIIDISDFGQTADGRFYFVMEFVDGKTLVRYRREGPFPFERVVHVGLQAARALTAAHSAGIIHRDLKPENIMLVQRPGQPDFVKVLDFGIAKVLGAGSTAKFTAVGSVMGTPQYMAPEQAMAGTVDARSDIYSLGLILHELIRGRPTFTGDSAVELMSRQLDTAPPELKSPFGNVPAPLARIVMQMLAKKPADRPASMEAVVSALEAVESTPTPARTEQLSVARPATTRVPEPAKPAKPLVETRLEPIIDEPSNLTEPVAPLTLAVPNRAPVHLSKPVATRSDRPDLITTPEAPKAQSEVDLAAVRPNRVPALIAAVSVFGAIGVVAAYGLLREPAAVTPVPVVEPAKVNPTPVVVPPVEPKAAPTAPTMVKLTLESEPEHVDVFEDEVQVGSTPLVLSRPPGTVASFQFQVRDFGTVTRKVKFEADTTVRVRLEHEVKAVKKPGPRPSAPQEDDLKDAPF